MNPIHIGNQTAFSAAGILDPFEFALANGFDAFELFPDKKPGGEGWDSADLDAAARAAIRDAAQARGIRLSVHAHWTANPLTLEAQPVLERDLDLASAVGAAVLNIHLYTEAGIEAYVQTIMPLLGEAAERGVRVSIENTPETTPRHFNDLFAALRSLDLPGARRPGMCFDLGHANLCAATLNDYLGYLDQLTPDVPITHLHVHENWGDADSHLPLFTGPAGVDDSGIREFLRRMSRRGYAGSMILEQWPEPHWLLTAARDRITELMQVMLCEPGSGLRQNVGDSILLPQPMKHGQETDRRSEVASSFQMQNSKRQSEIRS